MTIYNSGTHLYIFYVKGSRKSFAFNTAIKIANKKSCSIASRSKIYHNHPINRSKEKKNIISVFPGTLEPLILSLSLATINTSLARSNQDCAHTTYNTHHRVVPPLRSASIFQTPPAPSFLRQRCSSLGFLNGASCEGYKYSYIYILCTGTRAKHVITAMTRARCSSEQTT